MARLLAELYVAKLVSGRILAKVVVELLRNMPRWGGEVSGVPGFANFW